MEKKEKQNITKKKTIKTFKLLGVIWDMMGTISRPWDSPYFGVLSLPLAS